MKLFWKIFLSMVIVIVAVFSAVSSLMLNDNFKNSIDKEISNAVNENKVILYSFMTSLQLSDKDDRTEISVKDLQEMLSPFRLGQENEYIVNVYDFNKLVYQTGNEIVENWINANDIEENQCKYEIVEISEIHYVEIVSKVRVGNDAYVFNTLKSVQDTYDNGRYMIEKFKFYMVIAVFISIMVSLVTSRLLTGPIDKLTATVRQMSKGDYDCRADIETSGEVAVLVQQFNAMADQLSENMEKLKDDARKQEDFTAAFAHELKTPLTSIIGYSDMIRSKNLTEEKLRKYSDYIFSQGKRLEKLSHELLKLILLDKQKIAMKNISMKDLSEDIESIFSEVLERQNIKFDISFEDGEILGNKELLQSLLYNFIDNARKAIVAEGEISVCGQNLTEIYEVKIIDNGCGMDEAELSKIKEAFYMVDKSRARKEGGAGIGLTICEKIVELHDAEWKIQSEPGKGTTMTLIFPTLTRKGDGKDEKENL